MNNELTYIASSTSVEQTQAYAAALANLVEPADVIALDGDLGAGKTHFTQGFAAGLGIQAEVVSPTFTLMQAYEEGEIPLYHFDLYRLEDPYELEDIAFYEYVEADGVSVVEWACKFPDELPEDRLSIYISVVDECTRTLEASASGARSEELLEQWSTALKGSPCVM